MLDINFEEKISVYYKVSESDFNINSFISNCDKIGKEASRKLFANILLKAQDAILTRSLGAPWNPSMQESTPWACPRCSAAAGFKRRGSRPRTLKTSIGQVCFALLQVTCSECGKTFSPFPELLGFGSRRRLSRELDQKLCNLVKDAFYNKTARLANEAFGLNLSPHTVHRTVQNYGEKAEIVEDLSHISHLQIDSTKINATDKERGIDVHIALKIGHSEKRNGRVYRHKTLAVVQVSETPSKVKKLLKESHVDQMTVDGKTGMEKFVQDHHLPTTIQRCLWHIPRTTAHMIYLDGLTTVKGKELAKPLSSFLFNEKLTVKARLEKYDQFIASCEKAELDKTANFLKNARANLFTYKQFADDDIHGRTNSVIERQMREINRRMENGSRWSTKGAQNLLALKLIQEMNPNSYDHLWNLPKNNKITFQVILC